MSGNAFFMIVLAVFLGMNLYYDRRRNRVGADSVDHCTRSDATLGESEMLNWKVVSWSLASWAIVSFGVCLIWGLLTPEALHMHAFLEQILPGFRWLTWWSVPLGIVESFLLGFYAGIVYVPIYNFYSRRWAVSG